MHALKNKIRYEIEIKLKQFDKLDLIIPIFFF